MGMQMANAELASGIMSMLSFEHEAYGMEHGAWGRKNSGQKLAEFYIKEI